MTEPARSYFAKQNMVYKVYILQSQKDNRTYTGYTSNLENRLTYHKSGRVNATKHRRPLRILFTEDFNTVAEARARELWWKRDYSPSSLVLTEFIFYYIILKIFIGSEHGCSFKAATYSLNTETLLL